RDLAVEPPYRGGMNGLAASAAQAYTARRAGQAVVDEVVVAFAGRWKARAGVGVVGNEVRRRAREGEESPVGRERPRVRTAVREGTGRADVGRFERARHPIVDEERAHAEARDEVIVADECDEAAIGRDARVEAASGKAGDRVAAHELRRARQAIAEVDVLAAPGVSGHQPGL